MHLWIHETLEIYIEAILETYIQDYSYISNTSIGCGLQHNIRVLERYIIEWKDHEIVLNI